MPVRVIGLNLSHDSSVCLVEDGLIRAALSLERTTRVKRGTVPVHQYPAAMSDLTAQILASAGVRAADIDYWIATSTESRDAADEARLPSILGLLVPPERSVHLPHPGHHLAHASAAFYASGFDEAAALVIDAYGSIVGPDRERESAFYFRTGAAPERVLQTLRGSDRAGGSVRDGELWLSAELSGVGEIYRVITVVLGFRESGTIYDDAGKTMGLASYGQRLSDENLFIEVAPDGTLSFDKMAGSLIDLGVAQAAGAELRLITRPPRKPFEQFHYDLAAQVQSEFEEACLHLARTVLARTGSRSLVAAGGSFLNSTLNTRLLNEAGIDRLFVFPAATDDGNSAGAALYAYHNMAGQRPTRGTALRHLYLGPSRLAGTDLLPLAASWNVPARRHASTAELAAAAAAAIGRGEIIGWFTDRGEFGPRALGARSILCHPGLPGMKDKLNARVKFREAFRPFAGSVLAEHAAQWFDMPAPESPFMLLVCPVLPARQALISEVVHVDGTCRVQTVSPDAPGPFRAVIEAFHTQTGLPLVLNTSFNLRGMPIVERPDEALDCLFGSRLDRLFIGDLEITGPDFTALRPEAAATAPPGWDVGRRAPGRSPAPRLHEPGQAILDLADGTRTMDDIARQVGCDVDAAVDLALDLRRHGLLRWAGTPEVAGPVYPPLQYLPDRFTG
jgi:carbamoyltransferase